ncbi:MAG: hypothetical protein QOC82_556 [Frankiaceae bacterium]|jgi:hypothetical protein|nr:hypothetical protein [Frankiaceae bacterium]
MSAKTAAPLGLDRATHVDVDSRGRGVWGRRAGLLIAAAIPVLALIGVFGQRAVTNSATGSGTTLTVNSPAHVRGGLLFTTEITVRSSSALQDMKLRLDRGWFAGMVFNGIAPQPSDESSDNGQVVYDYGPQSSGTFKIWISWQTNPTNLGRHRQDIALYDGTQRLAVVQRELTVFP